MGVLRSKFRAWMGTTERGFVMDEHDRELLGLNKYSKELSRILRELLPAGANRDYDRMIELAKELEQLARECRDGNQNENPGE